MPPKKPPAKTFDIGQVVQDWAWRTYERSAISRKQRKLREKEKNSNYANKYMQMNIDWSKVRFKDETSWERIAKDDLSDGDLASKSGSSLENPTPNGGVVANNNAVASPKGVHLGIGDSLKADGGKPQINCLFQTKFTNNTSDVQEYTMNTEKTTKSTCTTELETCLTKGVEFSVGLKTPCEVFECNAGYTQELALTNIDGETIEEELKWGVESKITVKPHHIAKASLVVNEQKHKGDFVVESQIRGQIYVTFLDVKDNNSLVKAMAHDIAAIVEEYLERERRKGEPLAFVDVTDGIVSVRTKGNCNFRYGVNQEVLVDQIPLPGYENASK